MIYSSPGDLAPVFDAMLEKARRLCEADVGSFLSYGGQEYRVLASTVGDLGRTLTPVPGNGLYRIAAGEDVVQLLDVTKEEAFQTGVARERTLRAGTRTALAVALRKDNALIGAITTGRREVKPFTLSQIALLQNFAAQAVIAMENARLITETREALEQQTATAEVLQVINSSPGNLMPVFKAILEKAHNLCGAATGSLSIYNGEYLRVVAAHGYPESHAALLRQPNALAPLHYAVLGGERFIHIPDIRTSRSSTAAALLWTARSVNTASSQFGSRARHRCLRADRHHLLL